MSSEYIVKLDGQVVTDPMSFDDAHDAAAELTAEATLEGCESLYEVVPIDLVEAGKAERSPDPEDYLVRTHDRRIAAR